MSVPKPRSSGQTGGGHGQYSGVAHERYGGMGWNSAGGGGGHSGPPAPPGGCALATVGLLGAAVAIVAAVADKIIY